MSAGSDGLRMTPEHRVWKAVTAVPGEAYEPRDVCVMTGLPAVVVESVLSNMERRGLVRWDPVGEWYEARPTTLDAPWYGCGCSPYLYPTPGQLVVLARGTWWRCKASIRTPMRSWCRVWGGSDSIGGNASSRGCLSLRCGAQKKSRSPRGL